MLMRSRIARLLILVLLFPLVLGGSWTSSREGSVVARHFEDKISPLLLRDVVEIVKRPAYDYDIPVIVRLSSEAFQRAGRQAPDGPKRLELVESFATRLRAGQIAQILKSEAVEYVTVDAPLHVLSNSHLRTTGTDKVHLMSAVYDIDGDYWGYFPGYDGDGVTVAVVDSGIEPGLELAGRVEAKVDFTDGRAKTTRRAVKDRHGHGTHVAGIVAASGLTDVQAVKGMAPASSLVSLKVIDETGSGLTSNLILALQWISDNRLDYNIRVVNLSLGHAPMESYLNDPLGQAVASLVEQGVVVVASAGNLGKTAQYPEIWGAINSPGNHPAVITAAATNTGGTDTHRDDIATTYASRGPTYIDNLFKPDLVAPGNRILSIGVPGTTLYENYPELVHASGFLELSGSSMATAFVSGAAALLLQANPDLTPALVKLILTSTASKLQQPHALEQGNGLLNTYSAVLFAEALDVSTKRLKKSVPPNWDLSGETVWAGGAFASGDYVVHTSLVSAEAPLLWGNGVNWDHYLLSSSTGWAGELLHPTHLFWQASASDGGTTVWVDGMVWTDAIFWIDAVLWIDAAVTADGILWIDTMIQPNLFLWTDSLVGDP